MGNPIDEAAPKSVNHRTSDHLANERTFLAWIRTSVAVIGLGFVVARFSVWLRELTARFDASSQPVHRGSFSLPMGIGMMSVGGLLAVVASVRYQKVRRAIESNESAASGHAVTLVTVLTLAMTATLVTYMLATR